MFTLALLYQQAGQSQPAEIPYQVPDPIPGPPLAVTAYALFWVIALVFLVALYRRQSRIEQEMKALAEEVKRRTAKVVA